MDVFVGGNIGTPLISYVDSGEKAGVVVAEISSFQLHTIDRFRPKVAVLLNIAEDHLDRYPDLDAYVRSKGRIFENQGSADFAVLNGADSRVTEMARDIVGRKLFFYRADAVTQQAGEVLRRQPLKFVDDEKRLHALFGWNLRSGSEQRIQRNSRHLGRRRRSPCP